MLATGLILLCLGVLSLVRYSDDFINGWSSRSWPKTRGTIVRSWLEEWVSNKGGHSFKVRAVYAYQVAGIRYENDKIQFSNQLSGGDRSYGAQQLAKIAPAGQSRDVYYDPNYPSRSCLIPGVSVFYLTLVPCLTGLFLLGGVICTCSGLRRFFAAL
jgi:hypothetical protein